MIFFDVAARILHASGGAPSLIASLEPVWAQLGALLDVPKPKRAACLAVHDGFVHLFGQTMLLLEAEQRPPTHEGFRAFGESVAGGRSVFTPEGHGAVYELPSGQTPLVATGTFVAAGTVLTTGVLSAHDVLAVLGEGVVRSMLKRQAQSLAPALDDSSLELLLAPMFACVEIAEAGDGAHSKGAVITADSFFTANDALMAEERQPAIARQVLLGYTELAARLPLGAVRS
ncbi:MAG: hypothetical protein ABTQ32_15975 [Myxococcaceae bacterium]